MMTDFTNEKILEKIELLKGWQHKNHTLEKMYVFSNFNQALAFIVQVGLVSEKRNHHPEIHNSYTKVILQLHTHETKAITEKDFDLAIAIDKIE